MLSGERLMDDMRRGLDAGIRLLDVLYRRAVLSLPDGLARCLMVVPVLVLAYVMWAYMLIGMWWRDGDG